MPTKTQPQKPKKPYPEFPLTPHPSGQWCKKIRNKIHYFGRDANEALQKYLDERDDLQAGRTPKRRGRITTEYLVNAYLDRCAERVGTGDLALTTLADYTDLGKLIVKHLGRTTDPEQLRPADFAAFRSAVAKKYSTARLTKAITLTRQIIKWGFESELLEQMPRFGPDFKQPSKKRGRIEKANGERKLLTRDEIRLLIDGADPMWKAIILLGINGGLGNSDIAYLPLSKVGGEWLDYARGKTGIERRIPLWPETQAAIKAAIADRRRPQPEVEDLLFLSNSGGPLITVRKTGNRTDLTGPGFRRLAEDVGVYRKGMGYYWLRHSFQTIGDGAKDPVATSAIMGHADSSMAGNYREEIPDDRLQAVTDHVREWLFPTK